MDWADSMYTQIGCSEMAMGPVFKQRPLLTDGPLTQKHLVTVYFDALHSVTACMYKVLVQFIPYFTLASTSLI